MSYEDEFDDDIILDELEIMEMVNKNDRKNTKSRCNRIRKFS